ALVDPHLDADTAEGGAGLEEPVLDVGTQGVQGHPALAVELGPGHLGPAEAAGDLDPDALHHGVAQRRLDRLTHGPPEAHPARQLLGHALRDELGVGLRVLDLEDVQLHLLAGQLLQVGADAVGLRALTPDDDARPSGVDVDPDPVPGTFDVHLGDPGALQAGGHHLTDLDVLGDVVGVQLVRVPARLPVAGDAEAEPVRVDLLTHYSAPSPAAVGSLPAAFFVAFFTGSLSAVFFAVFLAGLLPAAFVAGLLSAGSAVFVAGLLPAALAAAFLAAVFFAGFFSAAGASASATAVDPLVVAPAVSSGRAGRRRGRDGRGAGATAS